MICYVLRGYCVSTLTCQCPFVHPKSFGGSDRLLNFAVGLNVKKDVKVDRVALYSGHELWRTHPWPTGSLQPEQVVPQTPEPTLDGRVLYCSFASPVRGEVEEGHGE